MHLLDSSSRRALGTATALSLAAALLPAQALAQEAAPQAAQGADDVATGLEEIVVTAQRRKENLQDVPISVTAITSSNLAAAGIGGTSQLGQVVPSVQFTRSGPGAIFFIRGVGNSSGGTGEEGANAFYIDGVYLGDLTQAGLDFNNIERIEVLKGPQGTLFGRNSSGGLVNIITKEPGDTTVVNASLGYGNYNTYQGLLYVASPLTEKVGVSIALTGKDQNKGFGTNFATGDDVQEGWLYGIRSKLVFRPGDDTKIVLAGDYMKNENDYFNGFNLFRGTVGVGGAQYLGDYNLNTTDPAYVNIRNWGLALTVEHEFDWATLTSITGRRDTKIRSAFDADYTPAPITRVLVPSRSRTFQEELRLASPNSRGLSWQAGLFFYQAIANVNGMELRGTGLGGLNSGYDIRSRMKTTSYAAFGEVSYDLTDTTHITGGLRYTHDKRDFRGQQTTVNIATTSPLFTALNTPLIRGDVSFNRATYRVAIRQDLTDDINVYASYNRGFKSGLFAMQNVTNPPVKPQTIDAFELGIKTQLFDNMLRFNLAGFHYKIKDFQVRSSPTPGSTLLLNAASVKVDGIEGEIELAPAKGLRLNANFTYLDSRFGSFPGAPFAYPNPSTCNAFGSTPAGQTTGTPTGGFRTCFGNAKGQRTPLSPKFASSLGASYRAPIGDESELIWTGLWSYSSTIYFEADNVLKQKAYSVLNGSLEYRPKPSWGVELWVKNLTDKQYYTTGVASSTAAQGVLAAPRTYGVNVKFDF
jgi:iron complex outermembrane recepter protein